MKNTESNLSFENTDELIKHLTSLASHKDYVFRGYGKQSELLPSIIRDKDWRNQEINLLSGFERYGLQYFSANNSIDFMSYAQHYGLPTRLLDFTYNPFIALSFALFMPKSTNYSYEDDKSYYYIRYCKLSEQNCFRTLPYYDDDRIFQSCSFSLQSSKMIYLLNRIISGLSEPYDQEQQTGEKAILAYFKKIYLESHPESLSINVHDYHEFINRAMSNFEEKKMLFVDANQCSQRIVMQQGLFMFPYTLNQKEHLEIIKRNTSVIKIHKDIREDVLDYLNTIGINTFRLMPDLQSVCQAVKRKVTEERQTKSDLFKKKKIIPENIHSVLCEAYDRYKKSDGYANIAQAGVLIKSAFPNFNIKTYGYSKLSDLIADYPDRYIFKRDAINDSAPKAMYKCR